MRDGWGHCARRNQAVELLRIASAFGIIVFHAKAPYAEFGYSGLVAFVLLSPFMDVSRNWGKIRSPAMLAKALLLPWLFWVIVYGVAKFALDKSIVPAPGIFGVLLVGTSIHLWFLPFMFLALAAINALKPHQHPGRLFLPSALAAAAILAAAPFWSGYGRAIMLPFPQWIHASAAIFFGIALGVAISSQRKMVILIVIFAINIAIMAIYPIYGVTLPYVVAIISLMLCNYFGGYITHNFSVQSIADCMFGVYLVHIFFLSAASRIIGSANYGQVLLAFAASLAAVWSARRLVPASRLVLG